jgi:hypothetical protein
MGNVIPFPTPRLGSLRVLRRFDAHTGAGDVTAVMFDLGWRPCRGEAQQAKAQHQRDIDAEDGRHHGAD